MLTNLCNDHLLKAAACLANASIPCQSLAATISGGAIQDPPTDMTLLSAK
jgi:hypothetical protein